MWVDHLCIQSLYCLYSDAVLLVFSHKGVGDNYGSNEITPIYFVKDEQ